MKFWVAEIHEIVKNTILHYTELVKPRKQVICTPMSFRIRGKCNELNDALKQVKA
jgi:hypothetical protein